MEQKKSIEIRKSNQTENSSCLKMKVCIKQSKEYLSYLKLFLRLRHLSVLLSTSLKCISLLQ